jgi:hypothetical protein
MKRMRRVASIGVAAALLAGGFAAAAIIVAQTTAHAVSNPHELVPLYDPTDVATGLAIGSQVYNDWHTVCSTAARNGGSFVIANAGRPSDDNPGVNGGPGNSLYLSGLNADLGTNLDSLMGYCENSSNVSPIGYVDAEPSRGDGNLADDQMTWETNIERDVDAWFASPYSHTQGIFFDLVSDNSAYHSAYLDIFDYVHTNYTDSSGDAAFVEANFGTPWPTTDWAIGNSNATRKADQISLEGDYPTLSANSWSAVQLPSWTRHFGADNFSVVVNDATTLSDLRSACSELTGLRIDAIYVTDGSGGNAYERPSTYDRIPADTESSKQGARQARPRRATLSSSCRGLLAGGRGKPSTRHLPPAESPATPMRERSRWALAP